MRKQRQHATVSIQPPLRPLGCCFCDLDAAAVITIQDRSLPLCEVHFSALRAAVVTYRGEDVKDSCLDKKRKEAIK